MTTSNQPAMAAAAVVVEPRTGFTFPTKLDDGKVLLTHGAAMMFDYEAQKNKLYAYGIYADDDALAAIVRDVKLAPFLAAAKPTAGKANLPRQVYEAVIDSDHGAGMMVRLVISSKEVTMRTVREGFIETDMGEAMRRMTSSRNIKMLNKMMHGMNDNLKLPRGSTIDIRRFPDYVLETCFWIPPDEQGEGDVDMKLGVRCKPLSRTFLYLYLGEDTVNEKIRERIGLHLLALSSKI